MTRKLRKAEVAARYGNVNVRTVDRWLLDPSLQFPKPFFVGRAPLWHESELERWERERARPGRPQTESTELRP
jgi:predicted DNA-binding transcriptional regulator AlpA